MAPAQALVQVILGEVDEQGRYYHWRTKSPAHLLPKLLQDAITCNAPVEGTLDNPLAIFIWTMRVVAPLLVAHIWSAAIPEKRKTKLTMERVKACTDRALCVIRAVLDNTIEALETSPLGLLNMAPTHWHATLYARYIHPLGEPWIQVAADPDLNPLISVKRTISKLDFLWGSQSRTISSLEGVLATFLSSRQRQQLQWILSLWKGPWATVRNAGGPYGALLKYAEKDPSRIVEFAAMCRQVQFYWPFPDLPSLTQTHTLAITAAATVTSLYILERNTYNHYPVVAHAARVARASFLPLFTDHLLRGKTDADVNWLSDEFLAGHEWYSPDSNCRQPVLPIHLLWPDVDGVLTWEHLPNHEEVLFQLKMWSLTGSEGTRLHQVLDKATPYRSKARSMGKILTDAYNDPPRPDADNDDKNGHIYNQWARDCEDAAAFRRLFNRLLWVSTQGLYAKARPQATWYNAIYCHVSIARAGTQGVVEWLKSGNHLDEEWNMLPLAVMREYLCAIFEENDWYRQSAKKYFDFPRFARDTSKLCNAMRDSFSSIDAAVKAVLPFKENTSEKLVYRQRPASSLDIVWQSCRNIVKEAMMLYFSFRVDIIPRLRSPPASMAIGQVIHLYSFLPHLRGLQATERLANWCRDTVRGAFPKVSADNLQMTAREWLKKEPSKQRPPCNQQVHIDVNTSRWMKVDLCLLSVYLSWPISGQCTANLWNFVSRQPPSERLFLVAALTLPQLGGIEHATSAIVQNIFLSDPIYMQPAFIAESFSKVSLWDASVLSWWAHHIQNISSVRLIARPAYEVDSIRHEKWKAFKEVYGERVGGDIVRAGGQIGADNPSSRAKVNILPPNIWRIYHLPCCRKVCEQLRVKRLAYDHDVGCMVCIDGLPRKHSAGPASTDANKTRRIVDSMHRMLHVQWLYGFWEYNAQAEQQTCDRLALAYAVAASKPYNINSGRLEQMGKDYEKEIIKRVTVGKDPIQEEKPGATQVGSHRTARTLAMLTAELRAFCSGDASFCMPLADSHEIVMSCPRTAVCYGFWWAAEHQIISCSDALVPPTQEQRDRFWARVIPNANRFVDMNLRAAQEQMNPNMMIGGTGMSTKNDPLEMTSNEELYKIVRSGPGNLFTEQCVGMPARSICVFGMRLHHASPVGNSTNLYGHCVACGKWYNESESSILAGLFVCGQCGDFEPVNRSCEAGSCSKHDTERSTILPLLVRDEVGSTGLHMYGSEDVECGVFLRPGIDMPDDIANAWRMSWWCKEHHKKATNWAPYWASYQKVTLKLMQKDGEKKRRGATNFVH